MDIQKKLPNIKENILLASHTTFKIGGPARWFFEAQNIKEIKKAVKTVQEDQMDYFILGEGSNILVSDKGFNGLVIKVKSSRLRPQRDFGGQAKFKVIYAEAGVSLGKLVEYSIDEELTGLEWAAGIPGTVGGAIRGNAGAFGHSISEVIQEVMILNKKLQVTRLPSLGAKATGGQASCKLQDLKFKYRDSIFKHNKNLIILSTEVQLKKGNKEKIQQMISEYLEQRKENQPLEYPSAGSVFKNLKLLKRYPQLKRFSKHGMIPAGWLIEECGLTGKKIGGAMVSEKHANFIVNLGDAKAEDVLMLISLIKQKIRNKFGIQLQEEIEYIGF